MSASKEEGDETFGSFHVLSIFLAKELDALAFVGEGGEEEKDGCSGHEIAARVIEPRAKMIQSAMSLTDSGLPRNWSG
jgi:hypothetical protein